MTFTPADNLSLIIFSLFGLNLFVFFLRWMSRDKQAKLWISLYIGLSLGFSALALSGITLAYTIPVAPLIIVSTALVGIFFSFSGTGTRLTQKTSVLWLMAIQGFRFPLELILHHWAEIGTIPATMTWTGSNIDILAGLVALLFVPLVKKNQQWAWVPEILGSLLLLNVLRVVLLSSPFPFSWPLENPLQLIFYFPYVLIIPLFVLPAFVAHILLARKLLSLKRVN